MGKVSKAAPPVLEFAEACDRGLVRDENQDSVRRVSTQLGDLLIVADGIGGYLGGATASRLVVEGFSEYLAGVSPDYSPEKAIQEAATQVNARIVAEAGGQASKYSRMGSTVVLALLQPEPSGVRAYIGHIGDSRAYLGHGGVLSRVTRDHSAVQALMDRSLITPEEALHHPDASVLTRSMGQPAGVEIEIDVISLLPGDTLLLCSDGLWGYVAENKVAMAAVDPGLTLETVTRTLLGLAIAAGGPDNIGIATARVGARSSPLSQTVRERYRVGFLEILAACLLAIAGLGAIAYVGVQHGWLNALRVLHRASAAAEGQIPKDVTQLRFAVIGGSDVDAGGVGADLKGAPGWHRMEVPIENRAACLQLARDAVRITVYLKDSPAIARLRTSNPQLFQNIGEIKRLDRRVESECGSFDAVVILPTRTP